MPKSHAFSNFRRQIAATGILLAFAAGFNLARAQTPPCAIGSLTPTAELTYPPIALQAHVSGTFVIFAKFSIVGDVTDTSVAGNFTNSMLLSDSARAFVRGLRADTYTGPRECPIVITFRIVGIAAECGTKEDKSQQPPIPMEHPDMQHFVVTSRAGCITVMYD